MACSTEAAEAEEEHGSRDDTSDNCQNFASEKWTLLFLCKKDTQVREMRGIERYIPVG